MAESLEQQMSRILDEEEQRIKDIAQEEITDIAKQTVQRLRDVSPKGATGDYAKGWARKKDGKLGMIVHNRTDYQLTHLLENGHVIRNQYGTYDRVNGIEHIKPIETWANNELVHNIEGRI